MRAQPSGQRRIVESGGFGTGSARPSSARSSAGKRRERWTSFVASEARRAGCPRGRGCGTGRN
jgi:hypothetical protein